MRYLVILGCSENDFQHILGDSDNFELACQNAKNAILSGSKFWNPAKAQDALVTKAFVYELAAEAIVNVEIKAVAKEVSA